ncbi:phosphotransferase [Brevibacillus choshinensis]|uniref:Phosphotransferase n=1 Tax=Brevibacillus choshinensis TaxID=54911 RepID=A0ABX7FP34_BRECH|nr:phosphotransferase [Brevibacillus choshinensis]QRG67978.1 phosphotransferase [Brevibacillus choshinensis]
MGKANQWDADWEISDELVGQLIDSQFPELGSKRIKRLGNGWDNTVYQIGDEYVFRFPRRTIAVDLIKMEGQLLPKLAEYVTIPYPKPLFYGKETAEYPVPFLGYHYVTGEFPLGVADEQRALSAAALGRFLKQLHSFPTQLARESGAPHDHRRLRDIATRKEKMEKFYSDLSPHMREEERRAMTAYLNQVVQPKALPQSDVFLHGDLHFKNMLVDERGRVSGIIDWGDMNVGHPAGDVSVAYSFLPPQARSAFFAAYGEVDETTKQLARMMAIYIPMLIWMQAIDDGDEKVAEEARATINRALAD